MKFVQDAETRKSIDFALGNQNKASNVPLIEQLVQKRQEEALLLGYSSYSEMVLEGKMAKNPATVQKFEDSLINRLSAQSKVERQKLTDFKRKMTGDPKAEMQQWDMSYYGNIYKQQ